MRRLLLAVAVVGACSPVPGGDTTSASAPPNTASADQIGRTLYITDSFNGAGLIPIDPTTLRDISHKPLLPIARTGGNNSWTTASLDGQTIAVMNYHYGERATAQGLEISIYDGRSGALRGRFNPEIPVIIDGLSSDGSHIYARNWPPTELTAERIVLDATNGKVLEREPKLSVAEQRLTHVKDDPARRFYALLGAPNAVGPGSLELGAWDLRTGKELWRTAIAGPIGGEWTTGRTVDGLPVRGRLVPGLALSADGHRLAVVSADSWSVPHGKFWLIDAASGRVISESSYKPVASFFEQLLAPTIAAAKSWEEFLVVSAAFSPDGLRLHAWARRQRVDEQGEPTYLYLGMVSVAIAEASVLGHDVKMEIDWFENRIHWVHAAPDGRSLYAFIERSVNSGTPGYALRRLDPSTLRVLAERRFDGYRQAFFLRSR